MKKLNYILMVIVVTIAFTGCATPGVSNIPNGGAAIRIDKPVWLSGIKIDASKYTVNYPQAMENEYLKVKKAGYWLANTQYGNSTLVYFYLIEIKKTISKNKLWTKTILSNPINKMKNITYTHYLNETDKTTQVTHIPVLNVKLNKKYFMTIEIYEDENRTKLITSLKQTIISPVDNTSGCIKLNKILKKEQYGSYVDGKNILTLDHLIIWCDKN